jgi:hypothetical protein
MLMPSCKLHSSVMAHLRRVCLYVTVWPLTRTLRSVPAATVCAQARRAELQEHRAAALESKQARRAEILAQEVQQKAKRETEKQRLLDANRRVYAEKVAAEEAEIAAKEKEASHFVCCSACILLVCCIDLTVVLGQQMARSGY